MSNTIDTPMSENQMGLWLLQTMNPTLCAYNVASVFRTSVALAYPALQRAMKRVVACHAILRTTFPLQEGTPVQCVHEQLDPPFEVVDATGYNEACLKNVVQSAHDRPFDLQTGPLMRLTLFQRAVDDYVVLLNWHHILLDFASQATITQEILAAYQQEIGQTSFSSPSEETLETIRYADFVQWQQEFLTGAASERHQAYWRTQLCPALPILNLPTDHPYPPQQSYRGHTLPFSLSAQLSQSLFKLASEQGVTPFTVLLAAYALLLAHHSGQEDLIVGVASDERLRLPQRFRQTLGYFVNLLPLRFTVTGDLSFRALLRQTQQLVVGGVLHQNYPFARMVQDAEVERDPSRPPLFDVSFNMPALDTAERFVTMMAGAVNVARAPVMVHGLPITPYPIRHQEAQVPLHLDMWLEGEQLVGYFKYNSDLFDEAAIARMTGHFEMLLQGIVAQPEQPVLQLPMLTAAEYQQIVHEWNNTTVDFGPPQTIHALFEQQVERIPDAIALVFEAEQLTYTELNARANQLAHHLIDLGVKPDTLVAVAMERSIEMVVSLLAILKAGGAYVPIDPTYPAERIRFMLTDSAAPILLTQSHLSIGQALAESTEAGEPTCHRIMLDQASAQLALYPTVNPTTQTTSGHLAYVIYTSGSTGRPKGAANQHDGVFNRLCWTQQQFQLTTVDRVLQKTPFSFDVSVWEFFWTLMSGATLVLAKPEGHKDPRYLCDLIQQEQITLLHFVPSMLRQWIADPWAEHCTSLRLILTSGEALPADLAQETSRLLPAAALHNLYGPTEAAVDVSHWAYVAGAPIVPIGKPIANTTLYVLDAHCHLLPIGVPGELYIGGVQLARGYLNRPELTAERFIQHPVFVRLYKTGDLCRWLPDGNIEYIGRTDFQVKIRGFRIELGEIESALLAQPGVYDAVVLAREETSGNKRLVAYLVGEVATETLRQGLAQRLPEYMLPSAFVRLDAMPLTPNGKLDRKALPTPDYAEAQITFVAPSDTVETVLAQAFAAVLRLEQVGIHDNFFHLGGDSILSIQVVSRAAQQGYHLNAKDIFLQPTVAQLASSVHRTQPQQLASQEVQSGVAPLLPIQRWFLAMNQPTPHHFNQSFLLAVKQPLELSVLERAIGRLLHHHDALRFSYTQTGEGTWQQHYLPLRETVPLQVVDLQALAPAQQTAEMAAISSQTQASLHLATGDLVRFVYFQMGREDRLLVVIHHLAVDGVSWRILLEDLTTLLDVGQLPPKTSSYREWGEMLQNAATTGHFDADIPQWLTAAVAYPLPVDDPAAYNSMGTSHHLTLSLSSAQTEQLLRTLPDLHHVTLDALLLTALTETLSDWSGQAALSVQFESHGRHERFDQINLNRTVGWFTSLYPLTIPRFAGSALRRVRYTLDVLRRVTDGGICFGVLQDFHADDTIRTQLAALPKPLVVYNYLGQLDGLVNHRFALAAEAAGPAVSPDFQRQTLLDSNAWVRQGQLQIHWTVSPQLRRETAEALLARFAQQLDALISATLTSQEQIVIPSDFADAQLSSSQLEALQSEMPAIETIYGLSPMQAGMLFHSEFAPAQGTYLEHSLFHVDDPGFDVARFSQAMQTVIAHHDSLRAAFRAPQDGEAVQLIYKRALLPVTVLDWRALSIVTYQEQFTSLLEQDRLTDFNLAVAPLLRLTVIQRATQGYDLLLTFHHLLMDRWSVDLFWGEVLRVYIGEQLPNVPAYQTYIHHLRQQPADAAFWRAYLRRVLLPTPLPGAVTTSHIQGRPASLLRALSPEASQQLVTFAREQGLTLNTICQAAWALLLARYVQENDVIFGMVTSGRTASIQGIETMVGLLINTLPFRVQLDGELTGTALLQQVAQTQLALQQREQTPLVDVQRWSELPAATRLFHTLFLFQNTPQTVPQIVHKLELRPGWVEPGATGYPLVALAVPGTAGEAVRLGISYDTAYYDAESAARLLAHWQQLLLGILQQPERPVLHLPMLTAAEYQQIVQEWNATTVDFGPPQTIHALFEQQVERTPHAVALVMAEDKEVCAPPLPLSPSPCLTYAELNARANQLAHHLLELGVKLDTLVAVAMERSIEMVVSLLAVLKAGGAYVPIDPTYPAERIAYMLADSTTPFLLTQSHLALTPATVQAIAVDQLGTELATYSTSNPQTPTTSDHLAYVIYTSGSTGQPKGVGIQLSSLMNLCSWYQEFCAIDSHSKVLQVIPIGFDASIKNILVPLLSGAQLILPPTEQYDPMKLLQVVERYQITIINCVPSFLYPIVEVAAQNDYRALKSLNYVAVGGEATHLPRLQSWLASPINQCVLANLYGPTECTDISLAYKLPHRLLQALQSLPIGKPIHNSYSYILDTTLQLLPIGAAGELYIGGAQLARGYLNRPDLTAERFIHHPQFGRLYKTGDLCRWLPDGNIEYIGRTDFQVKIRGFRIELGEIESALLAQAGVSDAVVLVREDAPGDKRLVAYLVGEVATETLRQGLAQRLPEYMLPAAFVRLDTMPLTPNGKLDRKALPAPDYLTRNTDDFLPPTTPTEQTIASIWGEVLGVMPRAVDDNFFQVGGHSLLATQVIARLRNTYQLDVPLRLFFAQPTVCALAQQIDALQAVQKMRMAQPLTTTQAEEETW